MRDCGAENEVRVGDGKLKIDCKGSYGWSKVIGEKILHSERKQYTNLIQKKRVNEDNGGNAGKFKVPSSPKILTMIFLIGDSVSSH